MEELIDFLNIVATSEGWPLSEECIAYLKATIREKKIRKGEFLLEPGNVCRNLYFIQTGLLKCFYTIHDDQVVDWFFGEGQTVVDIDSFYDQVPSEDWIQSIEDCHLYYISFDKLNYLYRNFAEFNVIGRVLTNKYLRIWHLQARNMRKLSSNERYLFLLKTQPELINRVVVQDLASYLGVNRETLSRARNKNKLGDL